MFGTTSGTRSTFFSFVVKWNSNGTGIKTVTSTGPFLHWNLQFQWKLHLWEEEEEESEENLILRHERVLHQLSPVLHPHNWLVLEVKQRLASLYPASTPSRPAKQRKLQLCGELLACLATLDRGYSPARTALLSEQSRTKVTSISSSSVSRNPTYQVALARQDYTAGHISRQQLERCLTENKFTIMYLAYQQARITS